MGTKQGYAITTWRLRLRCKHPEWLETTQNFYNEIQKFYYDLYLERPELWNENSQNALRSLETLSIPGRTRKQVEYGLDIDYCYKIHRNGYRIVELANAQINHKPGETRIFDFGGIKIKYGLASPWRYYMQARAIVWLTLEYKSLRELVRYCVKWGKVLLLFDNKTEYIKQLIHGTKDGIKLWKSIH